MTPIQALFVSEGQLGTGVMGPAAVSAAIAGGLSQRGDIDGRFVGLAPIGRGARLVSRGVPGFGQLDLDLQPVRWHVVQALRARRLVRRALAGRPADVLHVNSHSIAMGLGRQMGEVPTLLAVDVTVAAWQAMGVWRTQRPWSSALLRPSLVLERRAFGRAAAVLAFTEWSARGVREAAPEAPVRVLHPGIDLDAYRPGERSPRPRRPGRARAPRDPGPACSSSGAGSPKRAGSTCLKPFGRSSARSWTSTL